MDEVVKVGDMVRYQGEVRKLYLIAKYVGLYFLSGGVWVCRHEFTPVKWEDDVVGNTGIGVCAKNGSGS